MFFFGRKKTVPKGPAKAQPTAAQKRSSFRMPVRFEVRYTLRGRIGRRCGWAIDLSAGGMRLSTDEDLPVQSVLDLEFQLPEDFLTELAAEKEVFEQSPFGLRPEMMTTKPAPFAPIRVEGEVLSSYFVLPAKLFAYGIKFVAIEPEVQEELQRFVHLWQLHQLRLRREANR